MKLDKNTTTTTVVVDDEDYINIADGSFFQRKR